MKIALLSNVNLNSLIRGLKDSVEIYQPEGYGNELGILMNPGSSYHAFGPDITFLIPDLMELLGHDPDPERAAGTIRNWMDSLERVLTDTGVWYLADARAYGPELEVAPSDVKIRLEMLWEQELLNRVSRHGNLRILPYGRLVDRMGEERAYSRKMWYLGSILHSADLQEGLKDLILDRVRMEQGGAKKVLLLDLDNTLWGGLAGENDHTPIALSGDHKGLAYKDLQRVILQMQKQGVLLAIVSKNNPEDVLPILEEHPHMVLRKDAFAAIRINWEPKDGNIRDIARELNLGTDSMVFFDDNPAERELIRQMLPEVAVPDFPDRAEDLAPAMVEIYRDYFARPVITQEDLEKTAQYAANARREESRAAAGSFEEYLKSLEMVVERVPVEGQMARTVQLLNKTNQFNLTTVRRTESQLRDYLNREDVDCFLYRVSDRFGDNGVVACLLVRRDGDVSVITDFVMSCRVMGRNVEYAILSQVEDACRKAGSRRMLGTYLPTAKNGPVEHLYENAGYEKVEAAEGTAWELDLAKQPERMFYAEVKEA